MQPKLLKKTKRREEEEETDTGEADDVLLKYAYLRVNDNCKITQIIHGLTVWIDSLKHFPPSINTICYCSAAPAPAAAAAAATPAAKKLYSYLGSKLWHVVSLHGNICTAAAFAIYAYC